MLSPNAMNFDTASCGGRVTVTVKEQLADWPAAALVAVQPTEVVPTGNAEPDACVQLVWIGGVPPWAVGPCHVTATGSPVVDTAVCAAGQVSVSWAGGGGVGPVGVSSHAAEANATARAKTHDPPRRRCDILPMITQRFSGEQQRRAAR
jgi:hypothetical protein